MHVDLGGYHVRDIEFVAAFDIDKNKVGKDLSEAIYTKPNNTYVFQQVQHTGVTVERGMTHDGLGKYLSQIIEKAPGPTADIVGILKEREVDVMVCYLPVGSEEATKWYVEQALAAGVGFVNAIPVFIGREPYWQRRFAEAGLPVIGDDIKSQVGATISHRVLTRLFMDRGVRLDRTYQLNFGGNTDFLNMLERERLESKKISKTNAVTSMLDYEMDPDDVHVGPSDHVPWLLDRKWCYIRMEGTTYGDVPLNAELKLEVWDSPNSAGVITDAIRCLKLGLDRGLTGTLVAPSSYFMKSPPHQIHDDIAFNRVEAFIRGEDNETLVGTEAPVKKTVKRLAGTKAKVATAAQVTVRTSGRLEAPHRRGAARAHGSSSGRRPRLPGDGLAPACPARRARPARSSACSRRPRTSPGRPSGAGRTRNFGHVLGLPPGRPARPAPRAARLPRVRALPRRAHAPAVAAARRGRPARREPRRRGIADMRRIWAASPGGAHPDRGPRRQQRGDRARASRSRGLPISVVADDSSFPELFELSGGSASAWGVTLIPWRNLRAIFGVLRRREMLGLLVDWGYRSDGIPVRLFDAWTTLPAGPATLAAKTGSRILPDQRSTASRTAPSASFWDDPIVVASNDPAELQRATQAIADALAGAIRAAPAPVVQLQADLAGGRRRGGRPRATRARRCRPAGRIPGPAATCPGTRPTRSGIGRRRDRRTPRHDVPRSAHVRRVVAGLPAARGAALPRRRPGRRPLVPARARTAPPRRGATSAGSASALAASGRGSARRPRRRDRPARPRAPRPLRLPARRPLLPRGRPHPGDHPRVRRRAAARRDARPHRRGGRAGQGRSSSSGSISARSSSPVAVPRVPGRRDGDADGDRSTTRRCRPTSSGRAASPASGSSGSARPAAS